MAKYQEISDEAIRAYVAAIKKVAYSIPELKILANKLHADADLAAVITSVHVGNHQYKDTGRFLGNGTHYAPFAQVAYAIDDNANWPVLGLIQHIVGNKITSYIWGFLPDEVKKGFSNDFLQGEALEESRYYIENPYITCDTLIPAIEHFMQGARKACLNKSFKAFPTADNGESEIDVALSDESVSNLLKMVDHLGQLVRDLRQLEFCTKRLEIESGLTLNIQRAKPAITR